MKIKNFEALEYKTQVKLVFVRLADELSGAYADYTETYVHKSNKELYRLLSKMMQMCVDIEKHNERDCIIEVLGKMLKSKYGVKTQKNSKTAAIVAKYVTGVTRKTAHVYARVIETAMSAGVKADELAEFIEKAGGIDKLRQQTAKAVAQKQERKELFDAQIAFARNELRKRTALGTLQTQATKRFNLRGYKGAEFTYAVCRHGENGELEIVATLAQDKQLEEYALRCFACNWELAELEQTLESNAFIEACEERNANSDVVHWWMEDNCITTQREAKLLQKKVVNKKQMVAA